MTALRSDTSFVHQTSTPYRMSFKRHCVHPGKNCIAPSEEHRPKATAGLRLEPRLRVLSSAHHKTRVKSHSRAAMASRSLPRGHVKATASFHRRCGREFSVRRARSHRRPRRHHSETEGPPAREQQAGSGLPLQCRRSQRALPGSAAMFQSHAHPISAAGAPDTLGMGYCRRIVASVKWTGIVIYQPNRHILEH